MPVYFLFDLIRIRYFHCVQTLVFKYFNRFLRFVQSIPIMDLLKNSSSNDITSTAPIPKTIIFTNDEKKNCYETNKANVTVVGSIGKHDHGSSKVKLKSIVDYKWEVKNYPGRLIAVHLGGKHIAYAIKINNKEGKTEGMVRVVHSGPGFRALIKGMSSEVLDLEFANLKNTIILGCIEKGAVHVHKIENLPDKIICSLLIKIEDSIPDISVYNDQIRWCPYVPAYESTMDDEYVGQQLVWVRGNSYECYSIRSIVDSYGIGIHQSKNIEEGCLRHKELTNITCAVYSPDGTTLCVSCEDGHVRFYQVYFHTNETDPRRIHEWIPHNGKKITSLFFLDNHLKCISDISLWKHAITASDDNTEIKIWCCSNWKCLQTINFKSPGSMDEYSFKAEIDRTSSYLVLSDIKNRGLYALQIEKEGDDNDVDAVDDDDDDDDDDEDHDNDDGNEDNNKLGKNSKSTDNDKNGAAATNGKKFSSIKASAAYITSIAEFPLSWPILSFGIVDASVRKYKSTFTDSYTSDDLDDYDEDNHATSCVVIHMFIIHPKSVQECHVLYQLPAVTSTERDNCSLTMDEIKTISNPKLDIKQQLHHNILMPPDPSIILTSPKPNKIENNHHQNLVAATQSKPITLVTPDSFHSSGKITPDIGNVAAAAADVLSNEPPIYSPDKSEGVSNEVLNTLLMLAKAPDVRQKPVDTKNILNLVNNKIIEEQEQQKLRQTADKMIQKLIPSIGSTSASASASSAPILVTLPPTSGGSSPSREVQEILSLKDSDCMNDFYDAPLDLSDENDGESDDNKRSASESYNFNDITSPSKIKTKLNVTNKSDWPKVPQVPTTIMMNAKFNNINATTTTTAATSTSDIVNDINFKMDQLLEVIQTQTCQISELKNEMMELQKKNVTEAHKYDAFTKNIEFRLSKLIEEYLIRYEREHNKRLETLITTRDTHRDNMFHSMTQVIVSQVSERLPKIVLVELQRSLFPMIAGKLDVIKTQTQSEVIKKLGICDQLLKENIEKICTNKETITALSTALVSSIENGFQKIYVESMKTILIPAYEKSSLDMFKQIQQSFTQGTKSYLKLFETHVNQFQPGYDEMIQVINTLPEQLKTSTAAALNTIATQMHNDMSKDLRALQSNLIKSLRDNIKNEMQKGFETQAGTIEESVLSVVRSQAQTPAPSIFDVQEQIKNLLGQAQINAAFHLALVANDLTLVEYTLDKADFSSVFNPCPLQQTVLLSLIQQISADMSNHNDVKQKYLADAILALNLADATTREHAPKIMRELLQHCQSYIETNANSSLCSGVRMLMMAIHGLGLKLY